MSEDLTIVRILEKLVQDGYDLEIQTSHQFIKVSIITSNRRCTVNRYIPIDIGPRAIAKVFWDMSSSIKHLERKFNV